MNKKQRKHYAMLVYHQSIKHKMPVCLKTSSKNSVTARENIRLANGIEYNPKLNIWRQRKLNAIDKVIVNQKLEGFPNIENHTEKFCNSDIMARALLKKSQ